MIIDAWIQHPSPRLLADPIFSPLFKWLKGKPPSELPMALTVAALDTAKVDLALASAWVGPQGALISNDEVMQLAALAPGRILGLAAVDIRRPMAAIAELRRAVAAGMKGLRVLPWLWDLPPDDRRFYPLYATCVELGVPLCLQVGHTGPLAPSEPGRPIPYLERVCLDFPELSIVGGHIGAPWTEDMIFLARKFDRVHIDTSAYRPSRFPRALVDFMKSRNGRQKVLFGSNHPMLSPASCLAELDALGLDDEARALYLGGNANRVFALGR